MQSYDSGPSEPYHNRRQWRHLVPKYMESFGWKTQTVNRKPIHKINFLELQLSESLTCADERLSHGFSISIFFIWEKSPIF